jgi:iron complex outermembrane receptor protein
MRLSCCLRLALLAILAAAPDRAQAQSSPQLSELKLLSIEELAETDITGFSRRPEQVDHVAAAVQVITAEELRRYGVMNLPQALRLADTMHVASVGGPQWAISPRGFNIATANKMLVMIDGRTVYSPVFGGVFWEAQDIVIADIDRIEVVRGPGGTLWGANAVNGVIHVVTKNAADTRGTFINAAVGTSVTGPFAVRHGGRLGNAGSYRVYGKMRVEDSHELVSGGESNADYHAGQAGFRVESDQSSPSSIVVQGDLFSGRIGRESVLETTVVGGNLLARWVRRSRGGAETRVQGYYDHSYRYVPAQYRGVLHTIDFDAQHVRRFGRHTAIVGGGYRQYRGNDHGFGPGFTFQPQERVSHRSNLFAQAEFNIQQHWHLTTGAKLEHNEFTGAEVQPTVTIRWTRGRQTVWGSVSSAVRVPTRFDTDLRIFVPNTSVLALTGSPEFETEKVIAYEAGYRTRIGSRVSIDLATFDNRYGDLRSQEFPTQPGRPITLDNLLNATTRGIELAATTELAPWWLVHTAYTHLWKRLTFDAGSTDPTGGAAEGNDARNVFKARTHVNVGPRLELDGFYRYVGALPQPAVNGYSELDARASWRMQPGWDLAIIGTNLLHSRHVEFIAGTPPEYYERAVTLRSTWRF